MQSKISPMKKRTIISNEKEKEYPMNNKVRKSTKSK
jgi:hypothetical protein